MKGVGDTSVGRGGQEVARVAQDVARVAFPDLPLIQDRTFARAQMDRQYFRSLLG